MDFNSIFEEDINYKFFFQDYLGNKMMVGRVNLEYAIERLKMNEYYSLVMYKEGDELPSEYVPLPELKSDDGTLFATFNPKLSMNYICKNGGVQMISRISGPNAAFQTYLLGPGDEMVSTYDLINSIYEDYKKKNTLEENKGKTI